MIISTPFKFSNECNHTELAMSSCIFNENVIITYCKNCSKVIKRDKIYDIN